MNQLKGQLRETSAFFSCVVLLSICLVSPSQAHWQTNPKPESLLELTIDKTTPDEALKLLGPPASDKIDQLDVPKLNVWLSPRYKEKIFRELTYKRIGDFTDVKLSFLDDKLVMITLNFKKDVFPPRLKQMFGVEFVPLGGPIGLGNKPGEYPPTMETTAYLLSYGAIGISARTFIYATCSTKLPSYPGRVDKTRQISRILERK